MKRRFDVELCTGRSAAKVLATISEVTEREVLPFVSASTYPMQKDREFIAKVSANRFRIWKVPSSSRRRQNVCIPYLHGFVTDSSGSSCLRGSFALHPFSKLRPLLPLLVVAAAWGLGENTSRSRMFLSAFSLCLVSFAVAAIVAIARLRRREEQDIVRFLFTLFPDAQQPSPPATTLQS